jgi:anti-sigma factor RsiW
MTCKDVLELVEPIVAGEVDPDPAIRAHFESCPQCASALASARSLETVLASREAPLAPARFTQSVLQRIRHEHWRSEQNVDRLFNIAIAAALILVVGGVVALLNLSGFMAAVTSTWASLSAIGGQVAREAVPTVSTYIAGVCLLISALGMWWWAEKRLFM